MPSHDIILHPNGIPELIVEPPCEAFGAFLTLEAPSANVCAYLRRLVEGALVGGQPGFSITLNLFSMTCEQGQVAIAEDPDLSPGSPRHGSISASAFLELLGVWQEFLGGRRHN